LYAHLDHDGSIRQVVADINEQHDLQLELGRRCQGGLQGGAWELVDPDGRLRILKWSAQASKFHSAQNAQSVLRLRAVGYPTPEWLAVGTTLAGASYQVQEFVAGQPAELSADIAALLVDVIELQAGLAPDTEQDWSTYVTAEAFDGGLGRTRTFLCGLGPAGCDLVRHYDRVLERHPGVRLPDDDLVHGDLNSCNVLMQDGKITGLIDIEALGRGTRVIDYAWLVREVFGTGRDPSIADILRRPAEKVAGPGALAVCVTATVFDILRFIHGHSPDHVPRLITRMHELADYLETPQR